MTAIFKCCHYLNVVWLGYQLKIYPLSHCVQWTLKNLNRSKENEKPLQAELTFLQGLHGAC